MLRPRSGSYNKVILAILAGCVIWLCVTRWDAITRWMMSFASRYAPDL